MILFLLPSGVIMFTTIGYCLCSEQLLGLLHVPLGDVERHSELLRYLFGTPTSSMSMYGSTLMTVLAEKLTLFPLRLYLNRPSLPLSLCASS